MKRRRFSRFETAAQRLIEGSFGRIFGGQLEAEEVASKLARALEDSAFTGQVANQFNLYINLQDKENLLTKDEQLVEKLAVYMVDFARQANIRLPEKPVINLVEDNELEIGLVRVDAVHDESESGSTQQYDFRNVASAVETKRAIQDLDAFLIVDGRLHIQLSEPIMTLGRQTENDIILESSSVSRKHAQIRWRYNHFVIYDLGSRHGTLINGEPVTEYALQPGDVILLADLSLIYGEGFTKPKASPPNQFAGDTLSLSQADLDKLIPPDDA